MKRPSIARSLPRLLVLAVLATWMPAASFAYPAEQAARPTVSPPFVLAGGPGDQFQPALAGNLMVYSGCAGPYCNIFGLDLQTRKAFPISQGDWDEKQPTTDGQWVAWRDARNTDIKDSDNRLADFDIYAANLSDKKELQVTGAPGLQNRPDAWGNYIVWADFRDAQGIYDQTAGNIYMYDIAAGKETLVSSARSAQVHPVTNGKVVVWADYRNEPDPNGFNSDIYGYDIATGKEFAISNAPNTQSDPSISGNIVVWADWRKGDGTSDIYGYDLTTKQEFPISTAPGSQIEPAISGNLVVWTDFRNEPDPNGTNSDIYGYDLTTRQEFPVYVGPGPQGAPKVSGNTVVWEDSSKGNSDYDIMGATIGGVTINPAQPPPPTVPGKGSRIFPETGMLVTGLFLNYWNSNGGLAQQGFPISDPMTEVSDLDGKPYIVQYFERAVFEYHPENPPPYNVLLTQLGALRYKQKYPQGAPGQISDQNGGQLFPQIGHWVGGKFLQYWQAHGGLPQLGYPISDEFTEVSDLDGRPYIVQYFERDVLESHLENPPPYDVLLSQLGRFRYEQKYGKK